MITLRRYLNLIIITRTFHPFTFNLMLIKLFLTLSFTHNSGVSWRFVSTSGAWPVTTGVAVASIAFTVDLTYCGFSENVLLNDRKFFVVIVASS
jgi:lipoprotein signal peptidase